MTDVTDDLEVFVEDWWNFPNTVQAVAYFFTYELEASGVQMYEFFTQPWEFDHIYLRWMDYGAR